MLLYTSRSFLYVILIILYSYACGTTTQSSTDTQGTKVEASDLSTLGINEVKAHRNLEYTLSPNVESDLAQLDIFRIDDEEVRPLVLLVHGGSWASGDKVGFESKVVLWWIEQVYVAVPVNFRLASRMRQTPVVKPNDQVAAIASALACLMDHTDEYKIARDRVVLLCYSSGAHLVALLSTDERYAREMGLEESQIIVSISFDLHAYDMPYALRLMEGSVVEQNIPLIKHLFEETEEQQLSLSSISFEDEWAAQALIISVDENPEEEGTHGYIVSKTAERYQAALLEAGHTA